MRSKKGGAAGADIIMGAITKRPEISSNGEGSETSHPTKKGKKGEKGKGGRESNNTNLVEGKKGCRSRSLILVGGRSLGDREKGCASCRRGGWKEDFSPAQKKGATGWNGESKINLIMIIVRRREKEEGPITELALCAGKTFVP